MTASIFAAKVIGNTALGIWAGYNLSISYAPTKVPSCDINSIVTAPLHWFGLKAKKGESVPPANEKPKKLTASDLLKRAVESLHISAISAISAVPTLLAYFLADGSGKHPYLVYVGLGTQLVGALQLFGSREIIKQAKGDNKDSESEDADSFEHVSATSSVSDAATTSSEVSTYDKYSIFSTVVAHLTTFLFVVSTVGLAGDASSA